MVNLESERCLLKTLVEEDAPKLTKLVTDNKLFWSVHEPLHGHEFYSLNFQTKRIQESIRQMGMSREYSFGVFLKGTQLLIGHISVYSLKRLPFASAFIGYSLDERYTGQGFATEMVKRVTAFCFEELSLHRVEAYVSPANIASFHVLERVGYQREGLLKQLLFINGRWVDHYLYAYVDQDF